MKYMSASMGEVEVVPNPNGLSIDTPAELEEMLCGIASRGERLRVAHIQPDAFLRLQACCLGLARFAEVAELSERLWKRRAEHAEKALFQMQEAAKSLCARAEAAIDPETLRKWGLNPDAVREYDSLEDAMYAMGYVLDRCYERGPGIAATKPADDGHYVDPLDLLADDAP